MWFGYDDDNNWHAVGVERVKEIQSLNKKGKKPVTLQENESEVDVNTSSINSDLEAMDKKFSGKGKKKKKKRNKFRGKKPQHKSEKS